MGWHEPEIITPSDLTAHFFLAPISSSNTSFKLLTPTEGEYFILENRKQEGWDSYLRGEGMLIYHIDRTTINNKEIDYGAGRYPVSSMDLWDLGIPNIIGDHQCMDLLRANNKTDYYSYPGHPFPGSEDITTISGSTQPALTSWDNTFSDVVINNIEREENSGNITFNVKKGSSTGINYHEANVNIPIVSVQEKEISISHDFPYAWLEIFDIKGNKLISKEIDHISHHYLSNTGIYIIKINSGSDIFTRKLIINK